MIFLKTMARNLCFLAAIFILLRLGIAKPSIRKPFGNLFVDYCSIAKRTLQPDAYVDTDPGTLEYMLLYSDKSTYPATYPYITFIPENRTVYVVPTSSLRNWKMVNVNITFYIRVSNKNTGDFEDDMFLLVLRGAENVPERNIGFQLENEITVTQTAEINMLYTYIEKLLQFFDTPLTSKVVQVYEYTFLTDRGQMNVYYQNCTLRETPCDDGTNKRIYRKFDFDGKLTPEFNAAMSPEFKVLKATTQAFGPCTQKNSPAVAMFGALMDIYSRRVYPWWLHLSPYPGIYAIDYPKAYSHESEDFLRYELRDSVNFDPVPNTNYGYFLTNFTASTNTMYIQIMDETYAAASHLKMCNCTTAQLMFTALDSRNQPGNSILAIQIYMNFDHPLDFYLVTFTFTQFDKMGWPYRVNFMQLFTNAAIRAIGEQYRAFVFLKTFDLDSVTLTGNATWGLKVYPGCNFTLIRQIQKRMFVSVDSKVISSSFKDLLKPNFQLETIEEQFNEKCKIEPPVKKNEIPQLLVPFCGVFEYQIPSETFHDNQDGGTRNLTLKLFTQNMQSIQPTSWVGFKEDTQTINAVPPVIMATTSTNRDFSYKLVITDNSNQSITCDIFIKLTGTPPQVAYKITVLGTYAPLSPDITASYSLADKIKTWMKAASSSQFLLLDNQKTSQEENYLTFSQCGWKYDPCDAVKIHNFHRFFFNTDGSLKTDFANSLSPQFSNPRVSSATSGPCLDDKTPDVGTPWGPFTLSYCQTFSQRVPEATFKDQEQGNARNLDLEISANPPNTAIPDWIYFDSNTQTLSIVPYTSLQTTSYDFSLNAYDINFKSASQSISLSLPTPTSSSSHMVEMTIKVTSSSLSKFVPIYSTLRQNIKDYFQDQTEFVDYNSMTIGSVNLVVKWENCAISKTQCERNKLLAFKNKLMSTDTTFNPNFAQALQANFKIISLKFSLMGICIDETNAPTVANPIPDQYVGYCGWHQYTIPENTFNDKIDGNTRNMKLSVAYKGSNVLPNWIAFSETNQQIIVVLISTNPVTENVTTFEVTAATTRGMTKTTNVTYRIINTPLPEEIYLNLMAGINIAGFSASNNTAKLLMYTTLMTKVGLVYSLTPSKLHIHSIVNRESNGKSAVVAKLTSCNFINCSSQELQNIGASELSGYDTFKALPEFLILSAFVEEGQVKCTEEERPPVLTGSMKPLTVDRCSSFKYRISGEVFTNPSGFDKLRFFVMTINGQPNNLQNTWVHTDGTLITGVVTHDVIKSSNTKEFNLTVRATNEHNLFVETSLILTVSGDLPQLFYQYEMKITDQSSSLLSGLARQIALSDSLNKYFLSNIMNIVTYKETTGNQFNLIWSVCPLPNKCTQTGLSSSEKKLIVAGQPHPDFLKLLEPTFKLNSIQTVISPSCAGPLNPPVPTQDPFNLQLNFCGGFSYTFSENLFNDPDEKDKGKLKLYLETTTGLSVGNIYGWGTYDEATHTLRGVATYIDALNIEKQQLRLRAVDTTGLEGFASLTIKFNVSITPKYFYRFIMSSPFDLADADKYISFVKKLGSFAEDFKENRIGLYQVTKKTTDTEIKVFDCAATYKPCDLYKLDQMKLMLSDQNNFATTKFKDHMLPEFTIQYVFGVPENPPCGDFNPPVVIKKPPTLTIHLCGEYKYTIPNDTFYDTEQGYTRNLQLSLSSTKYQMTSFVEFTTQTQSLILIPSAAVLSTYMTQSFVFQLKATDTSKLFTVTDLTINVLGPYSILDECKIELTLTKLSGALTRTNVETMQYFVESLATYFQVTTQEIGTVSYTQITSTNIVFAWSYCSAIYRTKEYDNNANTLSVDYYNLQVKILRSLFDKNRKVQTSFLSIFSSQYQVNKVETKFTGRCKDLPPIATPGHEEFIIYLSFGGYMTHKYTDNYFYDYEDGGAYSLSLFFSNSNNHSLMIDHWVNIDYSFYTIYTIVNDYIRASDLTVFTYYLHATDSAKQSAVITFTFRKYTTVLSFAPFNITYQLKYNGQVGLIYNRELQYLINSIVQYFSPSISSYFFVLVRWYVQSPGYPQYRTLVFSVARETCASAILVKMKSVYKSQGKLDAALISSVSQMFTIQRVYDETSCSTDFEPPSPVDPIPNFNISYCTVFTYNLPITLFHDTQDGVISSLSLTLLDQQGQQVLSTSWMQLNTATMQLYAVAVQSTIKQQTSFTYQIQATNSRGLSSAVNFKANIFGQPYTIDCRITMEFQYKYMTENIVDLDIIRILVSMIQEYYVSVTSSSSSSSNANDIKIISFTRVAGDQFTVSWSHCAFRYSSQQIASQGLSENGRNIITQIFAKYVMISQTTSTVTNQVVEGFKTFMKSYFTILSISVNYDCIEEPPVPSLDLIRVYPKFCQLFNDSIPETAFNDKRDGNTRHLKLTLLDGKGEPVKIDNWLQLDNYQRIYGIVTEKVKRAAPLSGYKYYIRATDSSGRSANITYIVKVASPLKVFDVYFRIGFNSNLGELVQNAYLLYTLTQKLARFLDPTDNIGQIYVKEFIYPNSILFSQCDLEPDCTQTKVQNILQKLQTTAGALSNDFKLSMLPEFTANSVRTSMEPGKCGSMNFTIIVNPPPPTVTIPECGSFAYYISTSLFTDVVGRTTRDFYLKIFSADDKIIPYNSWIRANEAAQSIYGITVITKMSQSTTFNVQASHRLSGSTSQSTVTIIAQNFNQIKAIAQNLCLFTITVTSQYNSAYDDVNILHKFTTYLANYLNMQSSQLQIYSYQRGSGYPYQVTVTLTSCSLTTVFIQNPYSKEYYSSFTSIIQKLVVLSNEQYTNTINTNLRSYFASNTLFTVTSASVRNCTRPPETPPKSSGPHTVEMKCGISRQLIPADLFTDEQDGDTRQLKLELVNSDGSSLDANTWVFIDDEQYICGMINDVVISSAANGEYKFLIKATDSDGQSSTTTSTISVPKTAIGTPLVEVSTMIMPSAAFPKELILKKLLVNSIESAVQSSTTAGSKLTISQMNRVGPFYVVKVIMCDGCKSSLYLRLVNIQRYKDAIQAKLTTQVVIRSLSSTTTDTGQCSDLFGKDELVEKIPYCQLWKYDFVEKETEFVLNYLVQFPSTGYALLPSDSWLWYRNYSLEAYPPVSFWTQKVDSKWIYGYNLADKNTGKSIGRVVEITFTLVPESPIPETIDFKIILQENGARSQYFDNYYISMVMRALSDLVGGNGLHFVSFRSLQANPFRFEIKWENCSLPKTCDDKNTTMVNSILFNAANLDSLAVRSYFPPNITIVDIDSTCKNTPPLVHSYPLNLTIPVCGKYTYKVPKNISSDNEDALNLQTSLVLSNGDPLPRDSWIRYDSSSRMIYAMPNEGIVVFNKQWKYLLLFTDTKGHMSNLTVNIKTEQNKNVYYKIAISFKSLLPATTPYLDIQIKMLELISEYTKGRVSLDEYRVITFSPGQNEIYSFVYGDCSINQTICNNQKTQILSTEATMQVIGTTSPQANFAQFLARVFQIQTIQREPKTLNVIPSTSPINFGVIDLKGCQIGSTDVTRYFFEGDSLSLYTLKNSGGVVSLYHWVQKRNNVIYTIPWQNVTTGSYQFTLISTDKCQNEKQAMFTVKISSTYMDGNPIFGYSWTVRLQMVLQQSYPDVYYLYRIQQTMIQYLNPTGSSYQYVISIISYKRLNDGFEVVFGECSISYFPCDEIKITTLHNKLFITGSGISPAIQQFFSNIGTMISLTETRQETCGTPPGGPECSKQIVVKSTFCEVLKFTLPTDICKDDKDGSTRNLNIQLLTKQGKKVNSSSWVQFNQTSQTIYGYPLYSKDIDIPINATFFLRVVDNDNKATFVTVYVVLDDQRPNMDYQLTLSGTSALTSQRNSVDDRICIAKQISLFFGRTDINNFFYQPVQANAIQFQWSFCKQQTAPCECTLIRTTQNKLQTQYQVFSEKLSDCGVALQSTRFTMSGVCSQTNKPQVKDRIETTDVVVGQPYRRRLPSDMFVDIEDGGIKNMTLYITDLKDERLKGATWVQINNGDQLCGMLAYKDYIREGYQEVSTVQYKMNAVDSCLQKASYNFNMSIINTFPGFKYRIVFLLAGSTKEYGCKKTESLIQTIATYANMNPKDVFVEEFIDYNTNNTNGSLFTWGTREFSSRNCDGKEFLTFRELFVKDSKENIDFIKKMKLADHEVVDVSERVGDCSKDFPWWIIILILALIILFLLMWCLWCCIPRCCEGLCLKACPGCANCCGRSGRYSSMKGDAPEEALIPTALSPTFDDPDHINGATNNKEIDPSLDDPDGGDDILPPFYSAEKEYIDSKPITGGSGSDTISTMAGAAPLMNEQHTNYHTESWKDKRNILLPQPIVSTRLDDRVIDDDRYYYHDGGRWLTDTVDGGRSYLHNTGSRSRVIDKYSPYTRSNNQRIIRYRTGGYSTDARNVDLTDTIDGGRSYLHNTGSRSRVIDKYSPYTRSNNQRIIRYRTGGYSTDARNVDSRGYMNFRIKRSVLREYLRSKGQRCDGNIRLTEADLHELQRWQKQSGKDYTVSRGGRYVGKILRTESRLADALVDRRYVARHHHRNYGVRRHSTGSVIRRDDYDVLNPRDIHLRVEDRYYHTPSYTTTTTSSNPSERLYVVDKHYFQNHRYIDTTDSSTADEIFVTPLPSRRIPTNKKHFRLREREQISSARGGRIVRYKNLPQTTTTTRKTYTSYRNKGLDLKDESSV